MSPVTGLAMYFVIWWTALFAVLPWGTRPVTPPDDLTGWRGAPARPPVGAEIRRHHGGGGDHLAAVLVADHQRLVELSVGLAGPATKLGICRIKRAQMPQAVAFRVFQQRFSRLSIVFFVDGMGMHSHHHGQDEVSFLGLPCDWRFLPKLGPLRRRRAGHLFVSACETILSRLFIRNHVRSRGFLT